MLIHVVKVLRRPPEAPPRTCGKPTGVLSSGVQLSLAAAAVAVAVAAPVAAACRVIESRSVQLDRAFEDNGGS